MSIYGCLHLIVFQMTVRQKVADQKRVLDEVSRRRRQHKALEALESDNFSEDPHADLKMSKKAPKFEEAMDVTGKVTAVFRESFRLSLKQ